ncbi:hypothetical protein [Arenimonas sp.]|uniref:phage tail terminator protein n=1 Tax=Arenimonas sp. TaxID=1872635 RepID=UPI0025BBAC69|nr:hypothetical protein [Arenimonas sp.]
MALPADYLGAAPLIVERLRTAVPALRGVLLADDLAALAERTAVGPLAFVIYDGDEVLEGDGRARQGASQMVRQRWAVIMAVRSAVQHRDGALHQIAGPLLTAVIAALAGWHTPPYRAPLYRITAPRVDYGPNFALYPLLFAGDF